MLFRNVQSCTEMYVVGRKEWMMDVKRKPQPELESLSVSQARQQFSETLNRVYRGEARVIVEKSGIPVGAIVSPRDLADINEMQRRREGMRAALANTRAAFADIPAEEIEREIEKAVEEVKRMRALQVLRESQAAFDDVPSEEIAREVASAVAEVKAEMKQERCVGQIAAATSE